MNVIGDPAFTYTWTPANNVSNPNIASPTIQPDTSGTYVVTASYPNCPNITHSITFDVQPNPVVYVGPDRAICQWDTLQVRPIVTPAWYTNYSYDWQPANDIDFPNSKDIVFSGETDRTLTLTVTTPAGCTGSDNMQITVHPGNFASVSPEDTGICPLDSVRIVATGGVTYSWSPSTYLDNPNSATPVSHPTTNVNYVGMVTDQYGCKDTLYSNITVYPHALLELGDSVTIYPGESYQMDPTGNCLYFQWFPPLGLSADNIANPVAMPDVNTRYLVQAATENGCTATDSIVVMVSPESLLDMPNAFSPGSAPNDILKINKRGIATLKYFRIFNRWGTKVFETSDIDQGWNGQFNGSPQPMGVYVYMIEAYTNTGRRFYKQGNVTLIR
jgi:gliding motility-associated-like protein